MIKLSERLQKVSDFVLDDKISRSIIDVGCDHALLDIYLLQSKKVKKVVASDITPGALNQAKSNVKKYDVKEIDLRLGDGLNTINDSDKVDTVVLSGLGNIKINNILNENKKLLNNINTIIIQSNTMPDMIRSEVIKLGYKIDDERLVLENNIIYEIIKFTKGFKKYSKKEIYYGPILLKNKSELFCKKINKEIEKQENILNRLPKNKRLEKLKIKRFIRKLKKEIKK